MPSSPTKSPLRSTHESALETGPSSVPSNSSWNNHGNLTIKKSLHNYLMTNYLNLLLVFLPLGFISHFAGWSDASTFFLNFLAIIPLSKLLGTATEEIAVRTSDTVGGLLNASFGNAVELIISLFALSDGLIRVVQASLLGSILSNMLLVLGLCFLCGGLRFKEQRFGAESAQTSAAMLALALLSLLIPATFELSVGDKIPGAELTRLTLSISRGTSIIMLLVYFLFLYFQLKTHSHFYKAIAEASAGSDASTTHSNPRSSLSESSEEPQMLFSVAIGSLVAVTIIVAICAEFLVGSIEGLSKKSGMTETFIGLILVPIVGNAAEHVTAVTVAMKDKMDLAIGVAIGSSMQIAMLITPIMVIVGWIIGKEMTLDFHAFETVVLFMSVLITNYLIQDGKSNWLEGSMLLASYAIVAIAFFYYPEIHG